MKMFICIMSAAFIITKSFGQDNIKQVRAWEIHTNYWAPKMRGDLILAYPYMVKRNVKYIRHQGAIRIMLSPIGSVLNHASKWDTILNYTKVAISEFKPMAQVGYEWQKRLESSIIYYGVDVGWKSQSQVRVSHDYWINGGVVTIYERKINNRMSDVWFSGFVGVKYNISNRFSLSTESQLQFIRTVKMETFKYGGTEVYRDKEFTRQIIPFSYCLFNFSYNF